MKTIKFRQKLRSQLRLEALERARRWKTLIGTNDIKTSTKRSMLSFGPESKASQRQYPEQWIARDLSNQMIRPYLVTLGMWFGSAICAATSAPHYVWMVN